MTVINPSFDHINYSLKNARKQIERLYRILNTNLSKIIAKEIQNKRLKWNRSDQMNLWEAEQNNSEASSKMIIIII